MFWWWCQCHSYFTGSCIHKEVSTTNCRKLKSTSLRWFSITLHSKDIYINIILVVLNLKCVDRQTYRQMTIPALIYFLYTVQRTYK
jgi:hypothetical protein